MFFSIQLQAQQIKTTFKIVNSKSTPVPFASVTAIQAVDSTQILQQVSDSAGVAVFNLSQGLQYIMRASSVNYATVDKGVTVTGNPSMFTITLVPVSKTIGRVVVTTTRLLMRQEDDKTIVDPENLAASSTNAYEILEKTPGLFVDQDGNIYLSSTTPAIIFINGREQKMSAADIASMLKSLPPNSIASIEILRTPSAKYDASGSGGIVNVVLKKGVRIGLTGSATAGIQQGKYGNEYIGINLNNNNGRATTFLNVQYSRRNSYDQIKTDRLFAIDTLLSQDAYTTYPTNSYYLGFGIGYQLSKKWEINYDSRLSFSDFKNATENLSQIKKISTNNLITNNNADISNRGNSINVTQGLSTKYKIDSLGSEWTSDISYNYAPNNTNQLFTNTFTLPLLPVSGGDGDIQTKLHFFSAQTNLLLKLPKKLTVETGIKSTNVIFNNSTDYFRSLGNNRTKDNFRTSSYRYNESINAGYVQASKTISGITLKAGTRVESTAMNGKQVVPKDTSFTIHRTDFFPYIYLSKTVFKIAGYDLRAYLVYRRTISRPGYQLLNPSQRYIDQYLFETGNPALRPQFTKNYEANISVDERPIFAIGVNDTKDIFTNVIYQADSSRSVAYRTYDNLGNNKETYFRILGAIPPGKKFFFVVGAQYNHNFYQGLYENKPLSFKKGSWTLFTYQTLKVTPTTQLILNGFARFNGQLQFYELSTFGALNMSLNQQFLKKKMTVSLSANDIFFTNNNNFTINQGSINASGFRKADTRRFGVNIRYNFGFRKREENNMFNIESPEKTN
ncbi:MAG: TonB-dependent receptor [Segetibacter sp.]|nr:TonB-dependent receptor [Segetibacter sp.]